MIFNPSVFSCSPLISRGAHARAIGCVDGLCRCTNEIQFLSQTRLASPSGTTHIPSTDHVIIPGAHVTADDMIDMYDSVVMEAERITRLVKSYNSTYNVSHTFN